MKYFHSQHCTAKGTFCHCLKDRGYQTRQAIPVGSMVERFEDFSSPSWPAGTVGQVLGYDNMGFNGISAYVIVNGERMSCTAGMLLRADGGASYRNAVRAEYNRRLEAVRAAQAHADAWAREHDLT